MPASNDHAVTPPPTEQTLTTMCGRCAWSATGTVRETRDMYLQHMKDTHGITLERAQRKPSRPWSLRGDMRKNIKAARAVGSPVNYDTPDA